MTLNYSKTGLHGHMFHAICLFDDIIFKSNQSSFIWWKQRARL